MTVFMTETGFECPECGRKGIMYAHRRPDGDLLCLNCKHIVVVDKIHGYPVLCQRLTPPASATRPGRVVLVEKGNGEWATGWQGGTPGAWDKEWVWGHYFGDKSEAHADFIARSVRGY